MLKRHRSNYSLWPEKARPRRAIPLTVAVGGFAVGIVCAFAAHNVLTDFTRPTNLAEPARPAVADVPVYASPAPVAMSSATPADTAEPANRNRSRPAAAKMTLPSIGTLATAPTTPTTTNASTDGRGGAPAQPPAIPPAAASPAPEASPAVAAMDESKPAEPSPAAQPSQPTRKRVAAKAQHRKVAQRRRERPGHYQDYGGSFFGFRTAPRGRGGYGQLYAGQQYYY